MIKVICVLSILCGVLTVCNKDASLSGSTDDKIGGEPIQSAPWPDRVAPDFSAVDMDGRVLQLSSSRGKVVLLNLWTTWCYPCVMEIPALERIYRKYGGEDFEIMAVSLDQMETERLKQFLKGRNLTFTIL
ncbi:TlpA disulfide reductase family protein, partial [Thermodesulfobacteriota bacterium]